MVTTIISTSMVCLLVLVFLLLAARDLSMLVRRPIKGLGTGLSRVWAVGHTTVLEAFAKRVWFVPIIKLVVVAVLLMFVRPYDESERIPLYIRVTLTAQEIILLVMMWGLACTSMPQEREQKIVVTNASKPLSRLEMLLGKMAGFSVAAFLLVLVMFVTTWGILVVADQRIRANAMAEYTLAKDDYDTKMRKQEDAPPPPEEKKRLAQDGSLIASNIITPPKDGMSIVGLAEPTPGGVVRYLKGGSEESVVYRFAPRLLADENADVAPVGQRPYFWFHFPIRPYVQPLPSPIQIQISAVSARQRLHPQEATLALNVQNGGTAVWEPERVGELFSIPGQLDVGEVEITVSCPTPGVFLQVIEGVPPAQATSGEDYNMVAFPSRTDLARTLPPELHPEVHGFERHDKQQIAGPSQREVEMYGPNGPVEVGIFRFPGKELARVPIDDRGNFKLSMLLDLEKDFNQGRDTMAEVEVYNASAPAESQRVRMTLPVVEKRSTDIELPRSLLDEAEGNHRGDMVVLLRCRTPGHWISVSNTSVRVEQPPTPFVVNLFKSELVLLCEAVLLVVICVACSVRLGWPVAMLVAGVFFLMGYMRGFIEELLSTGGLIAIGFPNFGQRSATYRFFDTLLVSLWQFLGFVVSLTPDFRRYDLLDYITQWRNMPMSALGLDAGWTLLYALPFIGLGYLLMRKQELG